MPGYNTASGNIRSTISDNLAQFNTFADPPSKKSNVFERDWSKFSVELFRCRLAQYFEPQWKKVHLATNSFLIATNSVLNEYARFKKVNMYKIRFKTKARITPGIQKSIYIKNKLLKTHQQKVPTNKSWISWAVYNLQNPPS